MNISSNNFVEKTCNNETAQNKKLDFLTIMI